MSRARRQHPAARLHWAWTNRVYPSDFSRMRRGTKRRISPAVPSRSGMNPSQQAGHPPAAAGMRSVLAQGGADRQQTPRPPLQFLSVRRIHDTLPSRRKNFSPQEIWTPTWQHIRGESTRLHSSREIRQACCIYFALHLRLGTRHRLQISSQYLAPSISCPFLDFQMARSRQRRGRPQMPSPNHPEAARTRFDHRHGRGPRARGWTFGWGECFGIASRQQKALTGQRQSQRSRALFRHPQTSC
mmetsp:Transcript_3747/g.7993  ORF Transcript_3747/g.7993 Transcript_3747/m.7993 type:complete len:243 (-) Transcript_3747:71-799(-)